MHGLSTAALFTKSLLGTLTRGQDDRESVPVPVDSRMVGPRVSTIGSMRNRESRRVAPGARRDRQARRASLPVPCGG
jgi:hypothetical protein